ncbi:MAG: Holliday junction branch migration protein RuvA [Thermoanaerobaculia bacterium]|nr:Holliday junction branch migration protein RuvA [Thermoanaerobaculia bacterium]
MIGYLRGRLRSAQPELVIIDVGGVGYEVHVSLSTWYEIEALDASAEVELVIHTHVREDALQLFGFASDRERQLFLRLVAVSGIGPRLAQTILSGMAPGDFVAALGRGDVRALTSIPGVGKKTAERMVLELKDKVRDLGGTEDARVVAKPSQDELLAALVNLGYKSSAAETAISRVESDTDDFESKPFADKLRLVLRRLSRV